MRILYFSRDYTTHDHRFLSALAGTKHEVAFLQLERRGHVLEDRPLPPRIQLIPWAGGQSPVKLSDGPRLVFDLRNVIRNFNPDLIQAGPIQRCAFLTALCGFKPLVTVSWGYDLLHDIHKGRTWELATRYTLKRSAAMVGDCLTIRNLAIQYGMDSERIVTFPWGTNIQKYSPGAETIQPSLRERLGWDTNTFVLLSTRSWAPIYGVDDLAKAFVKAARLHPELRLFMLGNGPLAPSIRRIFQQGGVMDLVHFPGQVTQVKLPDFYRAADLYISTSHSDGTSISLLEALASGTPVLLSDIPGNKEWVSSSFQEEEGKPSQAKAGWLFQDGNVDSLTKGILHALKNRENLHAMSYEARQLAENRGNWKNNFQGIFEAYEIAFSQ
jgi:glycosyltransferase involved in cell wall biosynthesis